MPLPRREVDRAWSVFTEHHVEKEDEFGDVGRSEARGDLSQAGGAPYE